MQIRILLEIGPVFAAALIAWFFPAIRASLWALPSRLLRQFARSRAQAIFWSAGLSFAVCPIFSWVRPPSPTVHDEFSYLLASDTFAHGRLTNPPHPLWQHFESFHINHQPTYESKYPPGQGLFLALGQALTGRPIVGVWLSAAAAGAAVCWMLLAWMPPRWALFGALLPAFRFGTLPLWDYFWFAYWNTMFWGGNVAMIGGALMIGALPRLLRKPRGRDAVLLALGLLILANTRPFEGLLAALPVAIVLAVSSFAKLRQWKLLFARLVAPAAAMLFVGALAMGYYNYRGTGNVLKMPYMANAEQYEVAPLFVFQPRRPDKTYNHEVFRKYQYEFIMNGYTKKAGRLFFSKRDYDLILRFYWGYVLAIPLALLLLPPWNRWTVFAAVMIMLSLLGNNLSSSERLHLHYLAPVAPMFVFLAVAGVRRLRAMGLRDMRTARREEGYQDRGNEARAHEGLAHDGHANEGRAYDGDANDSQARDSHSGENQDRMTAGSGKIGTTPIYALAVPAPKGRFSIQAAALHRAARAASEATIAVCLLSFAAAATFRARYEPPYPTPLARNRPLIIQQLEATAGKDLVIVSYDPGHKYLEEWVYNGADLENAPIVWARDMGRERNAELIEHYSGRKVWELSPDENPPRLEPYQEVPAE